MKGRTDDLPESACGTCGEPFQPVKTQQRYCKPDHRPSAKTIAVRMPAALALAVHKAVERKREKMTDDEFDELFENYREQQERRHFS